MPIFRRRAVVSLFAGVVACAGPAARPSPVVEGADPDPLHVMSFNVRYGTAEDGDDA
jgi:hypothetical protein